jgi:hypothetical protein
VGCYQPQDKKWWNITMRSKTHIHETWGSDSRVVTIQVCGMWHCVIRFGLVVSGVSKDGSECLHLKGSSGPRWIVLNCLNPRIVKPWSFEM